MYMRGWAEVFAQKNEKTLPQSRNAPKKGLFILHIPQQPRQPQRQRRNVGHQHQYNKDGSKVVNQRPDHLLDLGFSYLYTYEKGGSHRRRDGTDTQVKDHHDTEMNGVHPQCLADGQEDGGEDQAGRCH